MNELILQDDKLKEIQRVIEGRNVPGLGDLLTFMYSAAKEILRLRARERWLIRQLAEGGEKLCPMPDNYQCANKSGADCEAKSDKMREACWSNAAAAAVKSGE